ncbi:hypothetical protein FSP39_001013 [Pinctada imbricata]|uniref:TGF-beta family profile domain-containing protein n=1 Tax=Pinctada imbricata TaxID=66713 RepID=A0AA88YWQ9_PINIB|nr:hypothetical protein FSP39_001013 [Pinctada imbricata]
MRRTLRLLVAFVVVVQVQSSIEKHAKRTIQKYIKLQTLKINLLSRLGLHSRPALLLSEEKANKNVLGKLSNSSVTSTLRNVATVPTSTTVSPTVSGNYFAEIQEVITLSEPAENVTDDSIFQFKIVKDSQGRKLEVQSANLLVKLKYKSKRKKNKKRKRKARKIRLELSSVSDDGHRKKLIASLDAVVHKTNWFKLAIPREIVEEKLTASNPNLKLHIKCFGCKKGAKLVLVHGSPRKRKRKNRFRKNKIRGARKNKKRRGKLRKLSRRKRRKLSRTRPFLLLHTKVKTFIRSKRDVEDTCTEYDGCCKAPFQFNFADVGWEDWVISPASFTTAFCGGNCMSGFSRNCTETRHKSLRIIYYDQSGSIIISRVPNMIVTECGCSV